MRGTREVAAEVPVPAAPAATGAASAVLRSRATRNYRFVRGPGPARDHSDVHCCPMLAAGPHDAGGT